MQNGLSKKKKYAKINPVCFMTIKCTQGRHGIVSYNKADEMKIYNKGRSKNMKEVYVEAEMEIVEFECEDIITNSTPFAPFQPPTD